MEAILITVYLIIAVALIAVILLQRSEGGGLGMGGGSTGLLTVRGSANLLTRTTAVLAALFFATAIGLTILSGVDSGTRSILERAADSVGEGADAPTTVLDALNALQPADSGLPVPALSGTTAPAETTQPGADSGLAVPAPADGGATDSPSQGEEPAATEAPAAPVN
jgi:preprotein translocase subunit SecG